MVAAQEATTRAPWEVELMEAPTGGSGSGSGGQAKVEVVSDLRAWLNEHTNFGSTWKWTHITMVRDRQARSLTYSEGKHVN